MQRTPRGPRSDLELRTSGGERAGSVGPMHSVGTLTYTTAGLLVLFVWLLWGTWVAQLKDQTVQTVVQLLLKRFEASDLLTGIFIGSIPPIINLVVVPIVSYRSDRHRGRWGRRIPFLLAFIPIITLSMIGLAFSPALGRWLHQLLGAGSPGLNAVILFVLGVFWTTFVLGSKVVADLLFVALINDVVPQAYLGRFFGLFRAVAMLAGIVFSYWLLDSAERHYRGFFIGFGLLFGLGFALMCLKVKEGIYPPAPAGRLDEGPGFSRAAGRYLRETFTKPYYLWVFAFVLLAQLSLASASIYNLFFAASMQLDTGAIGRIYAYGYLVSFGLAYPLGWLADRFHPLRFCLIVLGLYAATALWTGLYATDTRLFVGAFLVYQVVSSAWWTAVASLAQRLFPREKFAQYYSAMGIVGAIFGILFPLALGRFLDLTDHTYRFTYLIGSGIALLALIAGLVLHRRFMRLGGPAGYQAPE